MPTKIIIKISRKEYLLFGLVVALVVTYLCFFTDWFKNQPIRIEYTTRAVRLPPSGRGAISTTPQLFNVMFSLNGEYRLTSLKVVPASDYAVDPKAAGIWHLVADQPTPPTKGFVYGVDVPGMHPYIAGTSPQPIQPGTVYHVIVEAGKRKGESDFTIRSGGR